MVLDSQKFHMQVELPLWGRVDRACSYQDFAAGCHQLTSAVEAFQPDVALGVDWTARRAVAAATSNPKVPYVFLNYRRGFAFACHAILASRPNQ